jgi:hypothetical protein
VAVLAATAVALVFLGALGWWNAQRNQPLAAARVPADVAPVVPPLATPTGPPVYGLPSDLCEAADFTRLRPTFDQIGDLQPVSGGKAEAAPFVQCDGSTGNDQVQGTFTFRATVYADPTVALREYQAGRDAMNKPPQSTSTVGSAGESAYTSTDAKGGLTVEIYDGNLRLRMSWVDAAHSGKPAVDAFRPLMDTCESTMRLLRAN